MSSSCELVYTSAPSGLRPGSRGFCTVAMSEIMPPGLIGPLESLSAYRHVDDVGHSPVNFMHVQMKVAGRPINVLSRIAEAPPDYTGRTNKIAHHVVISTTDRAAGGPAAVLRRRGFAIETWDGEVRKFPDPKNVPAVDSPPRIARTWAQQSGDAGWGGTVASIFDSQAVGPPFYLIYQPEQCAELLVLMDEAICLLPESKRWNATFSTHPGEMPPGVQCRVRCIIAGSTEALALPPTAIKLDLATGTLYGPTGQVTAPPPAPLVDAARSGRLDPGYGVVATDKLPIPAGQPQAAVVVNPAVFDDLDALSLAPPPLSHVSPIGTRPLAPTSPSKPKGKWLVLTVAILLLLCLGGVAAVAFLKTDSEDLLAQLNASAGIDAQRPENPTPKIQREPDTVMEPETEVESGAAAKAQVDAMEAQRQQADKGNRQSLEDLAKRILSGETFLDNESENSISKFSAKVKGDLQLLAEQHEQLGALSLQPTDNQLATWVKANDPGDSLASFVNDRKRAFDALKQHPLPKEYQKNLDRLKNEQKAWDVAAKQWESEQEKQSAVILELPNGFKIEQAIKQVRAAAQAHLQNSMTSQIGQIEELSTKIDKQAEELEKKLKALKTELETDVKDRRDSHRLKIYFDGNFGRSEDKLQIKPRCLIILKADDLKAINRLRVGDGQPIPLEKRRDDVKLPGKFEGWFSVNRVDSGILFKLNPRSIPLSIQQQHPLLQRLNGFVKQQDNTFNSFASLQRTFKSNIETVRKGIDDDRQKANKIQDEDERKKKLKTVGEQEDAVKKIEQLFNLPPATKLDGIYIDQIDLTATELKSVKQQLADDFKRFADASIGGLIDTHIENLETLRQSYQQFKTSIGVLDLGGKLDFGNATGSEVGQNPFNAVSTFELFFFPELVYGPPPNE